MVGHPHHICFPVVSDTAGSIFLQQFWPEIGGNFISFPSSVPLKSIHCLIIVFSAAAMPSPSYKCAISGSSASLKPLILISDGKKQVS